MTPADCKKKHLVNLVTLTKAFQAHAFGSFFLRTVYAKTTCSKPSVRVVVFHERSKQQRPFRALKAPARVRFSERSTRKRPVRVQSHPFGFDFSRTVQAKTNTRGRVGVPFRKHARCLCEMHLSKTSSFGFVFAKRSKRKRCVRVVTLLFGFRRTPLFRNVISKNAIFGFLHRLGFYNINWNQNRTATRPIRGRVRLRGVPVEHCTGAPVPNGCNTLENVGPCAF